MAEKERKDLEFFFILCFCYREFRIFLFAPKEVRLVGLFASVLNERILKRFILSH